VPEYESEALHTHGTTLSYGSTQGGSYTEIEEVLDLDENFDVPEFKVTHLQSPGATHEYRPKLVEPGEVGFRTNYRPSTYAVLLGFAASRTQKWWKVATPDGATAVCFGHISKAKRSLPDDGPIGVDITIKRSGPLYFTGP
jgi:hypothetical protein